jgi:DEAD/DEAH box helicase domain-containing protein
VLVSRTASGKTLSYQVPILERLLAEPSSSALLLFPTKALAQDQLRSLTRFTSELEGAKDLVVAGTYDGDTSPHTRRKLRDAGNVILTNPDMLHRGILPYHSRWFRFFENLTYVVIDEMHTYRGIFGSHVAQVLRRLRRVLDHYGLRPTFVFSSATIGNPGELAERLLGEPVSVVERDGAPAGPRTFVFWNPPHTDEARMERRSSHTEAQKWLSALVKRGLPTIVFARTRVVAELIYRYARESLAKEGRGLADRISPYRGGYLPKERRAIEKRLFGGELLGVVSTNALELGIDVGSLDAVVMAGFPPTVAATLQRAGRAGRSADESLVVIIAYNEPIDQYLVKRPEEILGRNPEQAVVDLDNPYILAAHLSCAAAELPIGEDDTRYFGSSVGEVAAVLEDSGRLKKIEGRWYWSHTDFPASKVNLRNLSDDTYTIMDTSRKNEVIGSVDSASALELLYPEAIYLHEGKTYYVRELDLEQKVAFVEPREVDYYTQALVDDHIRVQSREEERVLGTEHVQLGGLEVLWITTAFKKIQFHNQDAIGYHALDLPFQDLTTIGVWYAPSPAAAMALKRATLSLREGMTGLRNVIAHVAPRLVMCDRQDLGAVLETSNTGEPTLFLYDRYPGGLGIAEKIFELIVPVLERCRSLVADCPCRLGCPSCVGVPPIEPAMHEDPEVFARPGIPGKAATLALLEVLCIADQRACPSQTSP